MSQTWRDVSIAARRPLADDIVLLELADPAGAALPAFTAGAHIDVQAGPELRQYSLCGDPDDLSRYRIAVLKDAGSRGGSRWLHEHAAEGGTLRIGEPRNMFPLHEGGHKTLLIAGGIGITPMLVMARTLHARGRDFSMVYCARSTRSAAFLDELRDGPFADRVRIHLDEDEGGPIELDALLATPQADTQVYVCGPNGLMDAVVETARRHGWAAGQLHQERFSAVPVVEAGERPFQLVLARSGRVIEVAADQTALDALNAAGIATASSCGQGYCGSCLTPVVEGLPDHRDQFLLDDERANNDSFTPCCSRALTPKLVLDL